MQLNIIEILMITSLDPESCYTLFTVKLNMNQNHMISYTRWTIFGFLCLIILADRVNSEVIPDWSAADKGNEHGNDYADEHLEPGQDYADVDEEKYGQAPPASEWMDYL